ncbi:FAD-binding oxidoreductase [Streptomycetaceae bacterium NBC_01309]
MTARTCGGRTPSALVLGAGISGLTSALALVERGFRVTIVAERVSPDIVSAVAGALWEWPPAVCGQHDDVRSLERSKSWCVESYREFTKLAAMPDTGVFVRPAVFYLRRPLEQDPPERRKTEEMRDHVEGFRHDAALVRENLVSPEAGAVDAYSFRAPTIDTEAYLQWLLDRVRRAGCVLVTRRIGGCLSERAPELRASYGADVVVNCSGLGALRLADDNLVFPLRGALLHVVNDGRRTPRITSAHAMAYEESLGHQNMVFIVPRGRDTLVLGGLVEAGEWSTDLGYAYAPFRRMVERCQEFLPALRGIVPTARPIRVGLRPARKTNVRLEPEPGNRVVHNYGHGGSGVTLSWGCAREVADLAAELA